MQPLKISMLPVLLTLIFCSCDPCNNLDCLSSNYYGQFRIVKASDGTDLVFGSGSIYDQNTIKFYALKGTDTTFFESQPGKSPNAGFDSILQVNFYPHVDMAFMRLSNGDIDTLKISYKTFDTRCCGTITEITGFRLNNSIDIEAEDGIQKILK